MEDSFKIWTALNSRICDKIRKIKDRGPRSPFYQRREVFVFLLRYFIRLLYNILSITYIFLNI